MGGVPGSAGQGRLGPFGRCRGRGRAPGIRAPSSARPGRSRPFPVIPGHSRPFPGPPLTHLPGPFPPRAGRAQPLPRPRGNPAAAVRGGPGLRERRGREGEEPQPELGSQRLRFRDCTFLRVSRRGCCCLQYRPPVKQRLNSASTPRSFMLVINSSIQRLREWGCSAWVREGAWRP